VTSPTPGEGSSMTAANLAVVMAQTGAKIVLVDSNLRHPLLHEIFEIPQQDGLTDLLCAPELDITCYLKDTHVENLQVLTSGELLPVNPSDLLSAQRMQKLLARLNQIADVAIFDSPPVLAVADAGVISTQVDGVVLLIEAGKTRREATRQTLYYLQQVGARILGAVLNGAADNRKGYRYRAPISVNGHGKVDSVYAQHEADPTLPVSPRSV
jgi:non-specific protein-tyrosine kinase